MSVSFMRPGSGEAAGRFLNWIDSLDGLLEEARLRLSIQRGFQRRRIDAQVGDRMEERHIVDFAVDRIETTDQATGAIQLVQFDLRHDAGITERVELDGC